MSLIAFVPIRSGSKSIKDKNIKSFVGKPLVYWILKALQDSENVDKIVVALDSIEYKNILKEFGFSKIDIYERDSINSRDVSPTISVVLEYLNKNKHYKEDLFLIAQATSPFTTSNDIDSAVSQFIKTGKDSLLSCVRTKRFFWNSNGTTVNYDYKNRPRRQDFEGLFMENGAFYLSKLGDLIREKNFLFGNIDIYEMPDYTAIEIDEPEDWIIAEKIMQSKISYSPKIRDIKLFLSDVDGVLTDAGMYYSENGDELKKFCTYDGMGFKILQQSGIKVGIITSEDKQLNRQRAKKLKLDYDFHGQTNKLETVLNLCRELGISLEQVAYIGDDINDLELLSKVGLVACPSNARSVIKEISNIIHLKTAGGSGAVREFSEIIIR